MRRRVLPRTDSCRALRRGPRGAWTLEDAARLGLIKPWALGTTAALRRVWSLPASCALVPASDDAVPHQPDCGEGRDPEQRGGRDGGKQLCRKQLRAVVVEQPPDPGLPLTEEVVADDGADHRQAGARLQTDEDRR